MIGALQTLMHTTEHMNPIRRRAESGTFGRRSERPFLQAQHCPQHGQFIPKPMGGFFEQKVLLDLGCGELLVGFDEVARDAMQRFNDGSNSETEGHEARQRDHRCRVRCHGG